MKVKFGSPKSAEGGMEGWKRVKEPFESFLTFYAVAVAIGIILLEVLRAFYDDFPFYKYIYLIILVLPIHELLHAIVSPKSGNSIIWIDFKKFLFCVTNDAVISKVRMIFILLTPFIILTITPFALSFYVEIEILKYIAIYNALGTGGDVISLFTIIKDKHKYYKMDGNDLYGTQTISI